VSVECTNLGTDRYRAFLKCGTEHDRGGLQLVNAQPMTLSAVQCTFPH
jgi:hypothetical protein